MRISEPSSSTTVVGARARQLVQPSSPRTTSARWEPSNASAPAIVSRYRIGDADELPRGARGVGQRAEHVEDRAHCQLVAHWDDEAGRWWWAGANMKPKPAPRCSVQPLGLEVDARAERLEHVGRPGGAGGGAVAVLGHGASGARGDQRGGGGDVERPAARLRCRRCRAGPPARFGTRAASSRIVRARPASSWIVSPFVRRPSGSRRLGLRDLAVHDLRQHLGGLLCAQVALRERARRSPV